MQNSKLPAAMAEVAESFSEAVGYEKLQWQRRRGAYGGLVAIAAIALGLNRFFGGGLSWLWWLAAGTLLGTLALVFAVRRRPMWQGVFGPGDTDLLGGLFERTRRWKKWQRLLVAFAILLPFMLFSEFNPGLPPAVVSALGILAVTALYVAIQLKIVGDRAMRDAALLAAIVVVPILMGLVPATVAHGLWLVCLGTAWLVVALFRTMGPRGWLVQ